MDYLLQVYQVGPDEVFVLGDNRNYSEDSHIWRAGIELSKIVGRVRLVYLPFNRIQRIGRFPLRTVSEYHPRPDTESVESIAATR
jgi:hypothetical protein